MLNSKILVLFVSSLIQAAFWVSLLFYDPFGMSTAADRASESIFLRLYPVMYPDTGREKIKVVMIDDQGGLPIAAGKGLDTKEWPLTFEEYVLVIEKVLEQNPKGVFVDILLDTEKDRNSDAIQKFIDSLGDSGPPVVFAAYSKPRTLIAPLQKLDPEVNEGGKHKRVFLGLVELTASPNHYQLSLGNNLSPAAVLYNETLSALNKDARGAYAPLNVSSAEMLLAWGNTVSVADAASSDCAAFTTDSASRFKALTTSVAVGISPAFNESMRPSTWEMLQPCAYHEEIAANDLFKEAHAPRIREAIEGSYVFIGASISGLGDVINSPVHGQLPGVYVHAMALDNLLTFKGKYLEKGAATDIAQFVVVFLCTFLGGLAFADRPPPQTRSDAAMSVVWRVGVWAFFVAIATGLLLLLLQQFHLAPYNWGGVLAVAAVSFLAGVGNAVLTLVRGSPTQ